MPINLRSLVRPPQDSGSGLKRTTGDSPDIVPIASPKGQIQGPARMRIAGHGMELKIGENRASRHIKNIIDKLTQ